MPRTKTRTFDITTCSLPLSYEVSLTFSITNYWGGLYASNSLSKAKCFDQHQRSVTFSCITNNASCQIFSNTKDSAITEPSCRTVCHFYNLTLCIVPRHKPFHLRPCHSVLISQGYKTTHWAKLEYGALWWGCWLIQLRIEASLYGWKKTFFGWIGSEYGQNCSDVRVWTWISGILRPERKGLYDFHPVKAKQDVSLCALLPGLKVEELVFSASYFALSVGADNIVLSMYHLTLGHFWHF